MPSRVAVAGSVVAQAVVVAVVRAHLQRAVEALPSFIANALEVRASTVSRAIVRAGSKGAVNTTVTSIATADSINTTSMIIAVVGACTQTTGGTLEPGEAVAGSVVAVALVVAVLSARQQRAIKAGETRAALAGHVQGANSVSAASVGADTCLTLHTRESRVTEADTIFTLSTTIAIVRARLHTAILRGPARHTTTSSIEADTMARAISGAGSQGTVGECEAREALAFTVHTSSVARTVVVTSLALNARDHER